MEEIKNEDEGRDITNTELGQDLKKMLDELPPEKEEVKVEPKKESVIDKVVPPHTKVSREVTEADIDRVISEVKVLSEICFFRDMLHYGAYAMHHAQIDDKDPLSLFVTKDHDIIINPVITRHSNYTVDSEEGCVTFPGKKPITVPRWQKIEVEYVTVMVDPNDDKKFKLSSKIQQGLSGMDAKVFQHEFDHGNAKYIYELIEEKKD